IAAIDCLENHKCDTGVDDAIGIDAEADAGLPDVDGAEPAAKSRGGGPRTVEGRNASRRNAMKDGLASEVVFPEELQVRIDRRTAQFDESPLSCQFIFSTFRGRPRRRGFRSIRNSFARALTHWGVPNGLPLRSESRSSRRGCWHRCGSRGS